MPLLRRRRCLPLGSRACLSTPGSNVNALSQSPCRRSLPGGLTPGRSRPSCSRGIKSTSGRTKRRSRRRLLGRLTLRGRTPPRPVPRPRPRPRREGSGRSLPLRTSPSRQRRQRRSPRASGSGCKAAMPVTRKRRGTLQSGRPRWTPTRRMIGRTGCSTFISRIDRIPGAAIPHPAESLWQASQFSFPPNVPRVSAARRRRPRRG